MPRQAIEIGPANLHYLLATPNMVDVPLNPHGLSFSTNEVRTQRNLKPGDFLSRNEFLARFATFELKN